MWNFGAIFIVIFLYCFGTSGRILPNFITRCKKHDPQMDQCMFKAVEQIRPYLKNGIPEMHIPSSNPLKIKTATLDAGHSFKATFENIEIYGLTNFKLNYIKWNFDTKLMEFNTDFNDAIVETDYRIGGKLLFLELDGCGRANATVEHASAIVEIPGKTKIIKEKKYFYCDEINLNLTLKVSSIYFDNIFKNNPEISARANKIIIDNVDSVVLELKPTLINTLKEVILGLLNNVMARYSVDDLFADD